MHIMIICNFTSDNFVFLFWWKTFENHKNKTNNLKTDEGKKQRKKKWTKSKQLHHMSTLTPISYFIKIISFILLNGKAKEIVHSFKKFFFTSTMSHKFVYSHWITKADKRVFTIFWGSTWWTKLLILIPMLFKIGFKKSYKVLHI